MVALGALDDLRQETPSRAERDPSLGPVVDLALPSVHRSEEVAALVDRPPSVERFDLDEFGALAKANGLNANVFDALSL
jgi:hypothetical protein